MDDDAKLFAQAILDASDGEDQALPPLHPGDSLYVIQQSTPRLLRRFLPDRQDIVPKDPARPLPEIIGGTIGSGTVNACAFESRGKYFIGVNWGLTYALFEVFRRLLSLPGVFTWIGNPEGEEIRRKFVASPLTRDLTDEWGKYYDPSEEAYPSDPDRRNAVGELAEASWGAICWHEMRHIFGGHVDFPLLPGGKPLIREAVSDSLTREQALVLQAFEFDADSFAINNIFANFDANHRGVHPGPQSFKIPRKRDVIEATLLVADTIFKTLDYKPNTNPSLWQFRSHPPLFLRRDAFVRHIDELISRLDGYRDLRGVLRDEIAPKVSHVSETMTGMLFGYPVRENLSAKYATEAAAYLLDITRAWEGIKDQMDSLRYFDFGLDRFR